MKKAFLIGVALVPLVGCVPQMPLPSSMMEADEVVQNQVQKEYYLKGKVALADFEAHTSNEVLNTWYVSAKYGAQASFSRVGLLSQDPNKAKYILSGIIKDAGNPSCFFGTCETGSSIEYTMIEAKSKKVVYQDLLVVPYTQEYPAFGANMVAVIHQTMGGAVGNNFAHAIHVLTQKTQGDLQ